jgi:hypothetical protein
MKMLSIPVSRGAVSPDFSTDGTNTRTQGHAADMAWLGSASNHTYHNIYNDNRAWKTQAGDHGGHTKRKAEARSWRQPHSSH